MSVITYIVSAGWHWKG